MKKAKHIKYLKTIPINKIGYKNALKLAQEIDMSKNDVFSCVTPGSFIFGDFIEAFVHDWDFRIKEMTVCTLSMSENNVDNLLNLIKWGHIDMLNLIVSDYFYANEIKQGGVFRYFLKESEGLNVKYGIARTHMKITQFETHNGNKIVIHGSANLRSSHNIEQFNIEQNNELYDFYKTVLDEILNKTVIKKRLTNKETNDILTNIDKKF